MGALAPTVFLPRPTIIHVNVYLFLPRPEVVSVQCAVYMHPRYSVQLGASDHE